MNRKDILSICVVGLESFEVNDSNKLYYKKYKAYESIVKYKITMR